MYVCVCVCACVCVYTRSLCLLICYWRRGILIAASRGHVLAHHSLFSSEVLLACAGIVPAYGSVVLVGNIKWHIAGGCCIAPQIIRTSSVPGVEWYSPYNGHTPIGTCDLPRPKVISAGHAQCIYASPGPRTRAAPDCALIVPGAIKVPRRKYSA